MCAACAILGVLGLSVGEVGMVEGEAVAEVGVEEETEVMAHVAGRASEGAGDDEIIQLDAEKSAFLRGECGDQLLGVLQSCGLERTA